MDKFLKSSRSAAKTGFRNNLRVHVILGSESCDLDSAVSTLAMAYFLSRTSSGRLGCPLVVPVLNIPRSQFHLRADVLLLFREAGVAMETLVFRDEVDLVRLHANRRLALTLVDHNVLPSADSDLEAVVVEVIDHHQLERTASLSCPVNVEMVASCATLVTERILSRPLEILDKQLALLLYGAMVVDSVNLSPLVGKVTVKDSQTVHLLQMQFPDLPPSSALHTALHKAKFSISGLTTNHILLNNMKTVVRGDLRAAASVVYMSLDSFLLTKNLQQQLCDFCQSHRLDAVVAMTISFSDQSYKPVRQLVIYSSNSMFRQEISHALQNSQSPALCLSPASSPYKDILAYHQGNALASRSKVLPVLAHFLSRWQQENGENGQLDQSDLMISDATADDGLPPVYTASGHHRRRLQLGVEDYGNGPPPPPMNSLVDGCPLDGDFNQEALMEKFRRMGGVEEEQHGGNGD
ncbi:protein prune homolog [Stegastes partitus]|uniref:Protein prune homolog n=1 Tax=Stegastes partitus TaxID=144197 RepID=A0A3B5A7L8_9TELE|nr:PREDICTED: protein prune homolog [Stegastes partitus]